MIMFLKKSIKYYGIIAKSSEIKTLIKYDLSSEIKS